MVGGRPTNVAEYCVTSYIFLLRNNISISYLKEKIVWCMKQPTFGFGIGVFSSNIIQQNAAEIFWNFVEIHRDLWNSG